MNTKTETALVDFYCETVADRIIIKDVVVHRKREETTSNFLLELL